MSALAADLGQPKSILDRQLEWECSAAHAVGGVTENLNAQGMSAGRAGRGLAWQVFLPGLSPQALRQCGR